MKFSRTTINRTLWPLRIHTALVLFLSTCFGIARAYAPPRENYHLSEAKELSEIEAVDYLLNMQRSAIARSYVFRFKLKHYPYRARTFTRDGTLYGQVDPVKGLQTERVIIRERNPENPREYLTLKDFLLIRSLDAKAWVFDPDMPAVSEIQEPSGNGGCTADAENSMQHQARALTGTSLLDPILDGISLSYFDLLVPYFYWREYEYLGPSQIKARATQNFKLYNPDAESELNSVQLHLDDEFRAILKAVYLDSEGASLKSMELVAFKKTNGTYIPKTIDYRSFVEKGSKTRIDIIAAAMDVELPAELFSKTNLGKELPGINLFVFDVF